MKKAVVVEDECLIRKELAGILRKDFGSKVYTARDGVEALRKIDTYGLPDMVITDVMMPRMDGSEMLHRFKQRGYRVPVIIFSDSEIDSDMDYEGALEHISKEPLDMPRLFWLFGSFLVA